MGLVSANGLSVNWEEYLQLCVAALLAGSLLGLVVQLLR